MVGFVLWTLAVRFLDVRAIGPKGTSVGFSTINGFVRDSIGVCMPLYVVTDWLGLLPVAFMFGFATLGVVQWIRRKNFFKVDSSILILGAFYIVLALVYVFFEKVIINYRPVLIEGYLEASYPSSTTLLVGCVMPTSILQCKQRIQNNTARKTCCILLSVFTDLRYSCISSSSCFISMRHPAILEQWSDTRSRSASMSLSTNPISIVHSFLCSLAICFFLSFSINSSSTCSRGSTRVADSISLLQKAFMLRSRIRCVAPRITESSRFALSENSSSLS